MAVCQLILYGSELFSFLSKCRMAQRCSHSDPNVVWPGGVLILIRCSVGQSSLLNTFYPYRIRKIEFAASARVISIPVTSFLL
jgi:hypothetical protein